MIISFLVWASRYGIQSFITYLQFIPGSLISVAEKQAADGLFIRNQMPKMFEAKFCTAQVFETSITTWRDQAQGANRLCSYFLKFRKDKVYE